METNIEIEKLGAYAKTLQRTADHLLDNLERQMLQDAEPCFSSHQSNISPHNKRRLIWRPFLYPLFLAAGVYRRLLRA